MAAIPRRYGHYVYGLMQSGLTCAIAAGISTMRAPNLEALEHWVSSWLISWAVMLPVVLVAAPAIRRLTDLVTRPDGAHG